MVKAFLSHSSKDKTRYIDKVVEKLGEFHCIYDAISFEEGLKASEEILNNLDKSLIFVLFISNNSINSDWVQTEIQEAYNRLKAGKIIRFYPIIIDKSISHSDERIPLWLREEYNLRIISRPTVAARRISQRIREISWEISPATKSINNLFVGRNKFVTIYENRFSEFDKPIPICLFVSGLSRIGRSSFIEYCLRKSMTVSYSYTLPKIVLNRHESIEDFILKLYDLGFSSYIDISNQLVKTVSEKVKIATKLIKDLADSHEILLIEEENCLINYSEGRSELTEWFSELLSQLKSESKLYICVTSTIRYVAKYQETDYLLTIHLPELNKKERGILLRQYSNEKGLSLSAEDLLFFTDTILTGYPEQIFYLVSLIKENNISYAKKNSYQIVEFISDRASKIIKDFSSDENKIGFLVLLSNFEFIGYDLLERFVERNPDVQFYLTELINKSICNYVGSNNEYLRVNDTIRDYVLRQYNEIPSPYNKIMKAEIDELLKNTSYVENDVSEFFFITKENLKKGKGFDDRYLIPSHFLKTMVELYDKKKNLKDVVILANEVLEDSEFLDPKIKQEVQYYLCLSLARLRDERFFEEIKKIKWADNDFLWGFYYRIQGNYKSAMEKFERALSKRNNFMIARRELVNVYIKSEEYEKAFDLAQINYEKYKYNPFNIQAYFNCVIRSSKDHNFKVKQCEILITAIDMLDSDTSCEMAYGLKSEYEAFIKNDFDKAKMIIDEGIRVYPNRPYPLFTLFDIAEKFHKLGSMEFAINRLKDFEKHSSFQNSIIIRKCIYYAWTGDIKKMNHLLKYELNKIAESSIMRLKAKIEKITTNNNANE